MNCKRFLYWNFQICKYIYTTNVQNSASREAKFMMKCLTKANKKNFNMLDIIKPAKVKVKATSIASIGHNPRRVAVLNKIFMSMISEHMSSFEFANQLEGKGFEITSVQISNDYKSLNIFWYANKDLIEVQEILNKSAGILTHELTQLRVIGNIPNIKFCVNKRQWNMRIVDDLISKMDLSDDDDDDDDCNEINDETNHSEEVEDLFDVKVPEMRHDIFNVNHTKIMDKILKEMKKMKSTKRREAERLAAITDMPVIKYSSEKVKQRKQDTMVMSEYLKQRCTRVKQRELSHLQNLWDAKLEEEYTRLNEQDDNDCMDDHYYDDRYSDDHYLDDEKYYYQDNRESER